MRRLFLSLLVAFCGINLNGADLGRVPNEFESGGGHSLGFANGGSAATSDIGSIRTNPAMLALDNPKYRVFAGYNWPTFGREFYQVGVVDSKTSSIIAGLLWTAPWQEYKLSQQPNHKDFNTSNYYDSPISKRLSVGLAYALSKFSLGLSGQYVEGTVDGEVKKGVTVGLGLAGLITRDLRLSAAVENMNKTEVRNISPRTIRIGLAYLLVGGQVTVHADYRQRERVSMEIPMELSAKKDSTQLHEALSSSEKMAIGSFSFRIQDLLRVVGGYGHAIDKSQRKSIGAGIAVVKSKFSLSYLISKPYLSDDIYHHAVNMSYNLIM